MSKFYFSKLFAQAWSKGMTIDNILSGFRKSGIFPFNPKIILNNLPTSSEGDSAGDSIPQPESENSFSCSERSHGDDDSDLLSSSTATLQPVPSDSRSLRGFQMLDFPPDKIHFFNNVLKTATMSILIVSMLHDYKLLILKVNLVWLPFSHVFRQ